MSIDANLPEVPNMPLPKAPSPEALAGYENLLAVCRREGVGFLGFACLHTEPAQETTVMHPEYVDAAKRGGVGAIVLEQNRELFYAINAIYERQRKYGFDDAELRRQMVEVVGGGYRTEYRNPKLGATIVTLGAFATFMADAIRHARAEGLVVEGVDNADIQAIRAGRYFADPSRVPPVLAASAREVVTVFGEFGHADMRALRDATGFRDDAESAGWIAGIVGDLRAQGTEAPLVVGTHGAFHLSMPPSLDTMLPERGVRSAKVIALTSLKDLTEMLQYYSEQTELEALPTTVFCFENGLCYDRKTGEQVALTAERLSIQSPPDGVSPPAAPAPLRPADEETPGREPRAAPDENER